MKKKPYYYLKICIIKIINILLPFRKHIVSLSYVHTNSCAIFIERLVIFSTDPRGGGGIQFTALKVPEPNLERVNQELIFCEIVGLQKCSIKLLSILNMTNKLSAV